MKIVHTADVHLRSRGDARWDALGAVLNVSREMAADVVVIAGDLFDRNVDAQHLRAELRSLFESISARIIIVPGNHDERAFESGDYYGGNVHLITGESASVDVGDARFIGLPYVEGDVDATARRIAAAATHRRENAANLLIYHGELLDLIPGRGAFGDEDDRDYMPARLATFARAGFDFVLAGHFHATFRELHLQPGHFVYPGSPASITRRELGRRAVALVTPGKPPQRIPLDTHHYESVSVRFDPFADVDAVAVVRDALRERHPAAQVLLSLDGFVNLAAIAMNEQMFDTAIRQIASEANVIGIDARWRDIGTILEHPLFARFDRRLRESTIDDDQRRRVRNLAISAFMEAGNAYR